MISRNSRRISSSRSGPLIALACHAQHLRLALRPVEVDALARLRLFESPTCCASARAH